MNAVHLFRATGLVLVLTLALLACDLPRPEPATKVVYQDVVKEVPRPCPVTVPKRPGPLARPLPESSARLIDLLTAKLYEWAGEGKYGDQADAALRTCTKE